MSQGILHSFGYNLTAFEFGNRQSEQAVIFIGGLGNKYLSVPYLPKLNETLSQWRVFQIDFSSSGNGWGTGSLDRDIDEIELLVKYLKSDLKITKVVLFGHSTGCQDSFHYVLNNKESVHAIVLQAPVSDREALSKMLSEEGKQGLLKELNAEVKEVYEKNPLEILPKKFSDIFFDAPINAYRWLSLAEVDGDDDYFSSDLPDEKLKKTFGVLNRPALFLISEKDQYMAEGLQHEDILRRWTSFADEKYFNGAIVKGASHDVGECSEKGAIDQLLSEVTKFFDTL